MNNKFLFLFIIYWFIFLGLILLKGELLLLAIPFFLYLSFAYLDKPGKPQLQAQRWIETARTLPGTPVDVKVNITNTGNKSQILCLVDPIHAGLNVVSGDERVLSLLPPGESVQLNYRVMGNRGIYHFDHVSVNSLGEDGLFEIKTLLDTSGELFILPQVPQLKRVSIRSWHTKVYAGNILSRAQGYGIDFFGVRSYQAGDPLRYINWRISERFPELLFSNEFERERVTDIWLILDARQRSNFRSTKEELFEHIILSGAGMAQALLKEGNRVGLLVYGGYLRWSFPGYGKIQAEKILRNLAVARPGDLFIFSDLENLPTRAFPLSSQLILVSPLHTEDIPILVKLRARGYSILVVSPNPVLFEKERLSRDSGGEAGLRITRVERQLTLRKLNNAGIRVVDWDVSIPFERVMQIPNRLAGREFHPMGRRR